MNSTTDTSKVFIVHGHDELNKLIIARTLMQLGLNPIILHEQANAGKTLIEKFEHNSNVGFAIILLTADDLGKAKNDADLKSRARQNVILELGYFIGKLGRDKVMALHEEGVELPSDLAGFVYVALDKSGHWKYELVKELQTAGYSVDANNLLK
jgi:predicted nucleotide-binding protein